jgi:hypothetical protein
MMLPSPLVPEPLAMSAGPDSPVLEIAAKRWRLLAGLDKSSQLVTFSLSLLKLSAEAVLFAQLTGGHSVFQFVNFSLGSIQFGGKCF